MAELHITEQSNDIFMQMSCRAEYWRRIKVFGRIYVAAGWVRATAGWRRDKVKAQKAASLVLMGGSAALLAGVLSLFSF